MVQNWQHDGGQEAWNLATFLLVCFWKMPAIYSLVTFLTAPLSVSSPHVKGKCSDLKYSSAWCRYCNYVFIFIDHFRKLPYLPELRSCEQKFHKSWDCLKIPRLQGVRMCISLGYFFRVYIFQAFPCQLKSKSLMNKRKAENFLHVRGLQEPQRWAWDVTGSVMKS